MSSFEKKTLGIAHMKSIPSIQHQLYLSGIHKLAGYQELAV